MLIFTYLLRFGNWRCFEIDWLLFRRRACSLFGWFTFAFAFKFEYFGKYQRWRRWTDRIMLTDHFFHLHLLTNARHSSNIMSVWLSIFYLTVGANQWREMESCWGIPSVVGQRIIVAFQTLDCFVPQQYFFFLVRVYPLLVVVVAVVVVVALNNQAQQLVELRAIYELQVDWITVNNNKCTNNRALVVM